MTDGRQGWDLRSRVAGVDVPVKVIWGTEDKVIPVDHARGLPGTVGVHIFEGAGHMIQMERPEQVNRLILEIAATG